MKIFLSYGRDQYAADALRIKADLQDCGHEVWFDLERLTAGRDWERYIDEGLAWCETVVLLMTPHAVRRRDPRDPASRDGYCLNEIARAIERNKPIIPVLLASLDEGPPLSICRLQYLDLREAVPIAQRESRYREQFVRLRRAFEDGELDFEGGQARLQRLLKPLDFRAEFGRHLARFTGRKWLLAELHKWLADPAASPVFWLTGAPGVGKTAFAVHLCHTQRGVIAYHLCSVGHDDKTDPRRALLSVAHQIAQHLPEYRRRIERLELESEVLKSAPTLFDNLLVQPFVHDFPVPDGPQVVVIDALDEAVAAGRQDLADLIRDHWPQMPPWLRLVVTSRPEPALLSTLASLRPQMLDARRAENTADLRAYLAGALGDQQLPAGPDVVEAIVGRSDGLFLYGTVVVEELRRGTLSLDRLEDFPAGMAAHFERLFRRQFPDADEYARRFRQVLECVCAAREPLPVSLAALAVGVERAELQQRLGRFGSLLAFAPSADRRDAEPAAAPFHPTLADWLTGLHPQTAYPLAGPYAVDVEAGRRRLAEACWQQYERGTAGLSAYARAHLAAHLTDAAAWQRLWTVLGDADLAYLSRWLEGGGHQGKRCLAGLLEHSRLAPPDAAGVATQLARICAYENDYGAARRWLQYALERASFRKGRRARAVALHELGSLHYYEGDLHEARRAYRRAWRCCVWGLPRYGDEAAANLVALAVIASGQGDFHGAERLGHRALKEARRAQDAIHEIAARHCLANVCKDTLRDADADTHLQAAAIAVALAGSDRDRAALELTRGWRHYNRAVLSNQALETAAAHFERALHDARQAHFQPYVLEAQIALAFSALAARDTAGAGQWIEAAEAVSITDQPQFLSAACLVARSAVAHQNQDLEHAAAGYRAAAERCRQYGVRNWEPSCLVGLGATAWHRGGVDEAESVWRQATRLATQCSPARQQLVAAGIDRARRDPRATPP